MITITEKQNCTGCHACLDICPQQCITMESDAEGFWYPQVNKENCMNCSKCEKVCSLIQKIVRNHMPTAYVAYYDNDAIRLSSSSGGIFTLIAEEVINNRGIVFGAAFDELFNVMHFMAENKDDLARLRSSKYVQSRIGDTYRRAKCNLKLGMQVLFTGTPCQIGGLKSYLGQDYDNLICQDIVCHGVPSPEVWKKYVDYRVQRAGASPKSINFRQKDKSWKRYDVQIDFVNGNTYHHAASKDSYMRSFLSNICLRPSCYACQYKTLSRVSDITLADYWGIQEQHPEMDDDKGTSLVLIHSSKGKEVFDKLKDKIIYKEVDAVQAVSSNQTSVKASAWNPKREKFFSSLNSYPFDDAVNKILKEPMFMAVYKKTRSIAGIIYRKLRA